MGWKFSLAGLSLLAVFKFAVYAYENSPLVLLLVLLALAILAAFFFGDPKKG